MVGVGNDAITLVEFYSQFFLIVSKFGCFLNQLIIGRFELVSNAIYFR